MARDELARIAALDRLVLWCAVGFGFPMRSHVSLFSYISEEKVSLKRAKALSKGCDAPSDCFSCENPMDIPAQIAG